MEETGNVVTRTLKKLTDSLENGTVLRLKNQVDYHDGEVSSKTLARNGSMTMKLVSMAKGEETGFPASEGETFLSCLEGVGTLNMEGNSNELHEGDSIVVPPGTAYRVRAKEPFKIIRVIVF